MSYEIVINIIPAGDETYERFEQIFYVLPCTIPEANVIRLTKEHATGITQDGTFKAIGIAVYQEGKPVYEQEF